MNPTHVPALLKTTFDIDRWDIRRPRQGARKECYIATSPEGSVFVKLDVRVDILERLGKLGVAPQVLAHGVHDAQTYVVQEFIDGGSPSREWLRERLGYIGTLFDTWHSDNVLVELLQQGSQATYSAYLSQEISNLEGRLARREEPPFVRDEVRDAYAALIAAPASWGEAELVPVHDEPNTSNMLVSPRGLLFVDWDDLRLADPFRDLGPFLWWYVPERVWNELPQASEIERNKQIRDRVFWFAARTSLDVALWHFENGSGADRGFLADFVAAANRQPNPRS
ncbi:MAG TPA: phosphotransferase [Thermomicrobiales bacterium]|nr:phosphotransferase [Thermomicrobiales bacterium]